MITTYTDGPNSFSFRVIFRTARIDRTHAILELFQRKVLIKRRIHNIPTINDSSPATERIHAIINTIDSQNLSPDSLCKRPNLPPPEIRRHPSGPLSCCIGTKSCPRPICNPKVKWVAYNCHIECSITLGIETVSSR